MSNTEHTIWSVALIAVAAVLIAIVCATTCGCASQNPLDASVDASSDIEAPDSQSVGGTTHMYEDAGPSGGGGSLARDFGLTAVEDSGFYFPTCQHFWIPISDPPYTCFQEACFGSTCTSCGSGAVICFYTGGDPVPPI